MSERDYPPNVVTILYRNWRGEIGVRHIVPCAHGLRRGTSEFHPEPGYLLVAFDLERDAWRTFAMSGILRWVDGWVERLEREDV